MPVVMGLWLFGIRSASDLAYLFTGEGKAIDFQTTAFPEVPPESAQAQTWQTALFHAWYSAQKAAIPEIKRMATSAILAHKAHVKRAGSSAQSSAPREVSRPTTNLAEPGDDTVSMTVASAPQLQDDRDKADAKRTGFLKRIFDVYMAMGKQGTMWDDEELSKTERCTVFFNALANVSTMKLRAILRIGTRRDIYLCGRADSDAQHRQ